MLATAGTSFFTKSWIHPAVKNPHEVGWFGQHKPNFNTTAPKLRVHEDTPNWFETQSAYNDKEKSKISGSVWDCGEQV